MYCNLCSAAWRDFLNTAAHTHKHTHGVLSEETLNLLAFLKHVKNYKLFVTS